MNIDIRKSITNNFKGANVEDIKSAIEENIKDDNELALPGLGVFFEVLWKNSNEELKKEILDNLKRNLG